MDALRRNVEKTKAFISSKVGLPHAGLSLVIADQLALLSSLNSFITKSEKGVGVRECEEGRG